MEAVLIIDADHIIDIHVEQLEPGVTLVTEHDPDEHMGVSGA
jgi:hypothetical protein